MQSQPVPAAGVFRPDGRSLVAASLCVVALFSDGMGWILAICGIVMLRRAAFSSSTKWMLAGLAIAPKILFMGVRSLNAPAGISFPIESWNLATSPSLWAWSLMLVALGGFLALMARRKPQTLDSPIEPDGRSYLVSALGLVLIAAGAVMLLGLSDDFHRIDDDGEGRWALRHAAKGTVAVFTGNELAGIQAEQVSTRRSGWVNTVRVGLTDGRTFSVSTRSVSALDELRKFATTANLPGKVRILRRGKLWTSGQAGLTLADCAGTYELMDQSTGSRNRFEFWLERDRLAGRETVSDAGGRHVRMLRNIKVSDSGDMEFQPAPYVEASEKQPGHELAFSFHWSPQGETARFLKDGFEAGGRRYGKHPTSAVESRTPAGSW